VVAKSQTGGNLQRNQHDRPNSISAVHLGVVSYATGLELQKELSELRHAGQIGNVLLLLEHPAVITLGRSADRLNILAPPELLSRRGIEVFESNRGGNVTYHGPGQLVGYPIFDLRSFAGATGERKTIRAIEYVRGIEEVLIRTCVEFGVPACRVPKLTGVWTQPHEGPPLLEMQVAKGSENLRKCVLTTLPSIEEHRQSAKIAAIGVHISRSITSHGFALNVNTNLNDFKLIVPCGIATKPVTSICKELSHALPLLSVATSVAFNFAHVFDSDVVWFDTLEELLSPVHSAATVQQLSANIDREAV